MPLQATSGAASQDAFGGNGVAVVPAYIEDVFSTWLYTGTGAALTITNNIDLSTKGGLVWLKDRDSGAKGHGLFDTARGVNKKLQTPSTAAEFSAANQLTAFNTTGFALGTDTDINGSGTTYASWTFRKQPKFFDIVTWTGTGSTGAISHSHALGSTPGCIIIKAVSTNEGHWYVYHRSLGVGQVIALNLTAASSNASSPDAWTVSSTQFSVHTSQIGGNTNGTTYIAYIFAHDAGGFGLTGTDNVISCGTFTTDGAGAATVNLGYEPQWVMTKNSGGVGDWRMVDNMRQFNVSSSKRLYANTSDAEGSYVGLAVTSTGFVADFSANETSIYIAIRRGPMKVPTTGTSVFSPNAHIGTEPTRKVITAGFPVDLSIQAYRNLSGAAYFGFTDRLRGGTQYLVPYNTSVEGASASPDNFLFDSNTTLTSGQGAWNNTNANGLSFNLLRRAPSFFDEVCYTGTGSATTFSHNLQAVPELMLVKRRSTAFSWTVYSASLAVTEIMVLNTTAAIQVGSDAWNSTRPTASVFSVSPGSNSTNASGSTYVAYLFATCAGVSKVFSYTGNGSSQTINCGFTAGARFVLIKRSDSTGDWYVWDTARGIVSGNDPHLSLNTTAAEVTTDDTIDTDNTGFVVNQVSATDVNVSSATYIGLAIA